MNTAVFKHNMDYINKFGCPLGKQITSCFILKGTSFLALSGSRDALLDVNRNVYPLPIFTVSVWHIEVTWLQHPLFFHQLTLKVSHFEHDCVNLSATLLRIWTLKMSGHSLVSSEMLETWTTLLNKNAMNRSFRPLSWSLRYTYSISC